MNKTTTSWLSKTCYRPEGYRVMVKSRHNPKQKAVQPSRNTLSQLAKSQTIQWHPKQRSQNYTEMKNYVRNRMKTQQPSVLQQRKSVQQHKKSVRLSKKPSVSQQNSNNLIDKNKREEELNVSRMLKELSHQMSEKSYREKEMSKTDLNSLQKKVQDLLDKRLSTCLSKGQTKDSHFQLQLETMIDTLKNLKKQDPETIQADITYLDRKIKLFERLMAENMTQSQILKKFYLAKLTNRQKHNRRYTEHCTSTRKLSMQRYCQSALRSSVVNSTTSKEVYRAPQRNAYNIYRYTNKFFNADRHKQPLPRSSYNRQFLVNPKSQDKIIIPKDNQFMGNNNSTKFLNSSYRLAFCPKKVEKTNIKDLDACKNKIKNLAVVYGEKERTSLSPNSYNAFLSKLRESEERPKLSDQVPILTTKKLISQSRRQYTKNQKTPIHSEIKHENLQKLKYQYMRKLKL